MMRRNSLFAIAVIGFIALVAFPGYGRGYVPEPAERAIVQIETEQAAAFLSADIASLERIWNDEFMFTAPNGMVVSKRGYLAMMKSGDLKYETFKLDEIKVRVFGDAAVVTGRATVKGKVWGHIIDGQDRYTTSYVKQDGKWKAVATHASRISQTMGIPAEKQNEN